MAASNKEMKHLRERLRNQGFDVSRVKSGHWRVISPNGRKCQIAATPSDHRAHLNMLTRLKRIGFDPKG